MAHVELERRFQKKKKKVMNLVVTTSIDYDKQRIADGWMR
jgi:hypothetical protein